MERVDLSLNGQWKLEKAKADMPGPYAVDHSNPTHKYEGDEHIQHMKHTLKGAGNQPHKAMKMAINRAANAVIRPTVTRFFSDACLLIYGL